MGIAPGPDSIRAGRMSGDIYILCYFYRHFYGTSGFMIKIYNSVFTLSRCLYYYFINIANINIH